MMEFEDALLSIREGRRRLSEDTAVRVTVQHREAQGESHALCAGSSQPNPDWRPPDCTPPQICNAAYQAVQHRTVDQ